jgi:hypothetical protein
MNPPKQVIPVPDRRAYRRDVRPPPPPVRNAQPTPGLLPPWGFDGRAPRARPRLPHRRTHRQQSTPGFAHGPSRRAGIPHPYVDLAQVAAAASSAEQPRAWEYWFRCNPATRTLCGEALVVARDLLCVRDEYPELERRWPALRGFRASAAGRASRRSPARRAAPLAAHRRCGSSNGRDLHPKFAGSRSFAWDRIVRPRIRELARSRRRRP